MKRARAEQLRQQQRQQPQSERVVVHYVAELNDKAVKVDGIVVKNGVIVNYRMAFTDISDWLQTLKEIKMLRIFAF